MNIRAQWLVDLREKPTTPVDGLILVKGFSKSGRRPEEVAVIEKAEMYGARAVFFETEREGAPPVPQALIFISDDSQEEERSFAELHKRLWSWGGVPLVYRVTDGAIQLFRCAHRPDFEEDGHIVFKPFRSLTVATSIAEDPWWDAERLRNGTLWDDPEVCRELLSNRLAAQKTLIKAVRELHEDLTAKSILPKALRRRLLILSVLIAYLEARKVFEHDFFGKYKKGATKFFEVLSHGPSLVTLLEDLEERFNGHIFAVKPEERQLLKTSQQLARFAQLVEGRQEPGGQLTLWQRYSFADLPVELISHIYQLFVRDTDVAVYTPHFVVRLMLGEALSWERLDRLEENNEVILDGACGSGIFLVEAYKRLVLHWRARNGWKRPNQTVLKRLLTTRIRGVDVEEGAVELAACSLCLALCDALQPEEIRSSVKLFPPLKGETILTGCFFETAEQRKIKSKVGVVVGNPPFTAVLRSDGEKRAYERYGANHGSLPDKQVAYLFLHESMEMLAEGGILCMVQQYNFIYNRNSREFRKKFFEQWDVREVLDFISVRGIFQKGGADTKVVVVVAEAKKPIATRKILHATFRRTGRVEAEQGFDIDYYDMHWIPRSLALANDGVWRADTVGGGRVLAFVDRLRKLPTLDDYARQRNWEFGEGWIEAETGHRVQASHITGHKFLPSAALNDQGIQEEGIEICNAKLFKSPYTKKRFTPPMLLVRSLADLHHAVWEREYLTYTQRVIGFSAPSEDAGKLQDISWWMTANKTALKAYLAATSPRIFTQKVSALTKEDIVNLPYDPTGQFQLTEQEKLIASDIVEHYSELIRLGERSVAMAAPAKAGLARFNTIFSERIAGVYKRNKLRPLDCVTWPGIVCQPYVFGNGRIDWEDAQALRGRINRLLQEKRAGGLYVTRIAKLYDGAAMFLLKPDRLRYWLPSIALRDADETLADLANQGF